MSKSLRALILFGLVAACGSSNSTAPRNLDNACSIIDQRPAYLTAMKRSEDRWGVPVAVQMATIYQESKFISNARTPHQFALGVIPMGRMSSAYGYSQALDGTWDDYKREQRAFGARRDNIRHATDFMGWYFSKSKESLGIPLADARNQYLAYHEGRGGYRRGSYRNKAWLMRVSRDVASRAVLYDSQLRSCGLI
ncbi:MAG: lytic transglycosylase [Silicimonas sp.]|nr:lytic transglycosylase [Silicimonas sp.]